MSKNIEICGIEIGDAKPVLIAGPCAIESQEMTLRTAEAIAEVATQMRIPFIFKASFDKANRMSITSKRGIGFPKGLAVLDAVKQEFHLPILTDVHETYQVEAAASVADILQIPAFLSRQTDLVLAAASAQKPINIKKGQFLAPQDMKFIAEKAESVGNGRIMLTERGTSFGYQDLVLDPRSIVIMKHLGYPVILDVTHLCQHPGAKSGSTGGDRKFIVPFARVGLAIGVDGIYMEVHPDPQNAISDKDVQIPLADLQTTLEQIFGQSKE